MFCVLASLHETPNKYAFNLYGTIINYTMLNISNNIFTYSRLYINKQRTEDENNACKSFLAAFIRLSKLSIVINWFNK
jgi:hypothetical protein